MPRMVTSSRCVTIVGSMAYLIGTRVDGFLRRGHRRRKRAHLATRGTERASHCGIRMLDGDARRDRCLPLE